MSRTKGIKSETYADYSKNQSFRDFLMDKKMAVQKDIIDKFQHEDLNVQDLERELRDIEEIIAFCESRGRF